MKYANIKNAWRTRKQALSHILAELVAGRLGATGAKKSAPWQEGCAYEAVMDGKVVHCAVGCLFTPAQIRSIKSRGLNIQEISALEETIGIDNLETVTGLNYTELSSIQDMHDGEFCTIQEAPKSSNLYSYLTRELKKA